MMINCTKTLNSAPHLNASIIEDALKKALMTWSWILLFLHTLQNDYISFVFWRLQWHKWEVKETESENFSVVTEILAVIYIAI